MKTKILALLGAALLAVPVIAAAPAQAARPSGDVPASQRATAWVSCGDGSESLLTVQPTEHLLSCGDANSGLQKMTWSVWSDTVAKGTGVYYWNTCNPNCSAGKNLSSPATITLSRVKIQHGEPVFTVMVVHYTNGKGQPAVLRDTTLPWAG